MDSNSFEAVVYDPTKLAVTLHGERVVGFDSHMKISISRRLNGVVKAKIYLQATSPWVLKLKEALGHPARVEAAYPVLGSLSESMRFVGDLVVKGYDVDYTSEIPVFTFLLESEKQ
nr:MAG: hypothetical protein [Bacteriophage sp.]